MAALKQNCLVAIIAKRGQELAISTSRIRLHTERRMQSPHNNCVAHTCVQNANSISRKSCTIHKTRSKKQAALGTQAHRTIDRLTKLAHAAPTLPIGPEPHDWHDLLRRVARMAKRPHTIKKAYTRKPIGNNMPEPFLQTLFSLPSPKKSRIRQGGKPPQTKAFDCAANYSWKNSAT